MSNVSSCLFLSFFKLHEHNNHNVHHLLVLIHFYFLMCLPHFFNHFKTVISNWIGCVTFIPFAANLSALKYFPLCPLRSVQNLIYILWFCFLREHIIKQLGQLMRLLYLLHRRPGKAQASLRIRAVSPEPSLFAHMTIGSRQRVRQKSDI